MKPFKGDPNPYFFSPRKGKTKALMDYQEAEKQGMLHGKCDKVYSR